MPTIQSVQRRVDRCTFAWGVDDAVELEYLALTAAAITKDDFKQLLEAAAGKSDEEQKRVLAAFFCRLATSWNVYEWEKRNEEGAIVEHGPMIPLDVEHVAAIQEDFVAACAAAIIEHVNLGKVSGLPLSQAGIATTSPMDAGNNSPATKVEDSPPKRRSLKSRSKAASQPGN